MNWKNVVAFISLVTAVILVLAVITFLVICLFCNCFGLPMTLKTAVLISIVLIGVIYMIIPERKKNE